MEKLTFKQACEQLGLPLTVEILPTTKTWGNVSRQIGITLHQTGAPGSGNNARAMANYQRTMSNPSNPEEKSWHLQVDDSQAIQSFNFSVGCWASSDGSGPGNHDTIQIESCINSDGDYIKTLNNTAKLMAAICYVNGYNPYRHIYTHYYWSSKVGRDKWCPAQILSGKQGYTLDKMKDLTQDYLAKLGKGTGPSNPKGMKEIELENYKPSNIPFKILKVGEKVTLEKGWLWYNPQTNRQLLSGRQSELTGKMDTIKQVKDIKDVNHSRYAYLLDNYNSWILEEHLKEPKADFKAVKPSPSDNESESGKDGDKLPEGHFVLDEIEYVVEKVKK